MAIQEKENSVAKKKGRPGEPPKPHMVKFTMDDGPHQTLREEAAKRGMSMSAYSAALVLEGLGYDKAPPPKGHERKAR